MWLLKRCLAFIFMITVTAALHSPYNVTMEAMNTRYLLMWDWDQTQANYTMTFTSDYTYFNNENLEESYRRVCYRTAERRCDFSHQNLSYSGSFLLRVRAESKRERSPWSAFRFCPDEQAALGPPPRVQVQSGEAMLTFVITEPLTVYNTSMSAILPLSYRLQYWKKHTPQSNTTQELKVTRGTLTGLKPWTDYCLRICTFHLEEEKTSPYTSAQCMKTGGRGLHLQWYILLVCCFVIFATCLIFWRRDKIRSFFLYPTLPSSIQAPPPSAMCRVLETREDSWAALVLVAQQDLGGAEDRRAEQDSAQVQDSSGLDSGISSQGESDGSC